MRTDGPGSTGPTPRPAAPESGSGKAAARAYVMADPLDCAASRLRQPRARHEWYRTRICAKRRGAPRRSGEWTRMSVAPPGIASYTPGASVGMRGSRGRVRAAEHRVLECEQI